MTNFAYSALAVICSLSLLTIGQSPLEITPDQWRGQLLGQTTPEEAVKTLGPPAQDKKGRLEIMRMKKQFPATQYQNVFRKLEYKDINGFEKARLFFQNDKLVMIELRAGKSLLAQTAANSFNISFRVSADLSSSIPNIKTPSDAADVLQDPVYLQQYSDYYYLIGETGKSVVLAWVDNKKDGAYLRRYHNTKPIGQLFGYVRSIQIISKELK